MLATGLGGYLFIEQRHVDRNLRGLIGGSGCTPSSAPWARDSRILSFHICTMGTKTPCSGKCYTPSVGLLIHLTESVNDLLFLEYPVGFAWAQLSQTEWVTQSVRTKVML